MYIKAKSREDAIKQAKAFNKNPYMSKVVLLSTIKLKGKKVEPSKTYSCETVKKKTHKKIPR